MKRVGILALQGCVGPHRRHFEALDWELIEIRSEKDIIDIDAYILPGGESSTMLNLISVFGLEERLKDEFSQKPVWGICAGAILMATKVTNPSQKSFELLDMNIVRNGYGRQLNSSVEMILDYEVTYIRAPIIDSQAEELNVHHSREGKATWLSDGKKHMATTFHPELNQSAPSPMHQAFNELIN